MNNKVNKDGLNEYDLLLYSDLSSPTFPAKYWKNHFNEVTLSGEVYRGGFYYFTAGETINIGALPIGFRPNRNIKAQGSTRTTSNSTMTFHPVSITILTNGEIVATIGNVSSGFCYISFQASFVAY